MKATELYEQQASLGQALSSPIRLRLLHLLSQGERSVESLAAVAEQPLNTVSHHLQRLRAVQLVRSRKEGRYVVYGLADESVVSFWLAYRAFAEQRLPGLRLLADQLEARRTRQGAIEPRALRRMLRRREAAVLDVRPADEFAQSHIPGAINIPLPELEGRLGELPGDTLVVLCCRGPYCLLADDAQQLLAHRGVEAVRLREGVIEWAAQGLPLRRASARRTTRRTGRIER